MIKTKKALHFQESSSSVFYNLLAICKLHNITNISYCEKQKKLLRIYYFEIDKKLNLTQ